jgi:pyruvate-formate lyase-activating enzyme
LELLKGCGQLEIHGFADTSSCVTTDVLLKVSENTDLLLFDLELMDKAGHRHYIGVSNTLILQNTGGCRFLTGAKISTGTVGSASGAC